MDTQTKLIEELSALRKDIQSLTKALSKQNKPWLTAKEAAEILGFPPRTATEAMSGLDQHLTMKHTRPKLYLAKDVHDLLNKVTQGKVTFQNIGNKKVLIPLK
jgi:prophage antirepressor-like protein